MKIRVFHALYGCETGCCGHLIEFYPGNDGRCYSLFDFDHAPEDPGQAKEWARAIAEDFIGYSYPECLDSIDWESLEIDTCSRRSCSF